MTRSSDAPTRREYFNFFIYPNVNYVVMAGVVHLIQQFCPSTPDRTEVRLTMALGRRKERLPAAPAILWSQLKAEKRVIDEDVVVFEGAAARLARRRRRERSTARYE